MRSTTTTPERPPYLAATVASVVVLVLYVVTLGPSTAMWDTSEYIAAAYTLGIPHPPGNPLFVLIGRVFTLLPIAPNIAMRVNLLAAVSSAITAGVWFLLTERVLSRWIKERWQRHAGAALAALIGATAFTVWSQSVVNEKVYTVALAGLALISWLTVRWCDAPHAPNADKLLVLVAYLMGLGYANHMAGILALPAIAVAIAWHRPKTFLRWRLLAVCAAALVLGATPFATQPIRSAHFPTINEGEVTGCANKLALDCTLTRTTYERFKYNFDREQYAKPSVLERQAPFSAQVGMWWQYFRWQWVRNADGGQTGLQTALAAIFLTLGLVGAFVHFRHDRSSFAYFAPLVGTITVGLIYYLNFRYGATQPPADIPMDLREVRDRDYFYLWSFSAWGVWAALGLVYLWRTLAELISSARRDDANVRAKPRLGWALASPVLAVAFVPLFANWDAASRRGDTDTADWARDLLNSVEPYGILITGGDNDMFPLWYAQEVEGIRRDVIIANTSLMNTDWFVRQMVRRPVFEYDADTGPELYRGGQWKQPSGPPLKMSLEEVDSVPIYQPIQQPMQFVAGNVRTTVEPQMLERADWFVYRLILDNPDRPVHFARSTAGYAFQLGLGDYVATHGLTRRLARTPLSETDTMKLVRGEGWVDLDATIALWNDFDAPAALIRKDKWIDRPSAIIPNMYVNLGLSLQDSMLMRGDTTTAAAVFEVARSVARAARLGELSPTPRPTAPPLDDTAIRRQVPPTSGARDGSR